MNLRNKILMTLFALGTIFWGCDSLVYDDLADCPQGVYVKFYSMTPCESDSTFIGSVPSLTVFAFDENQKLVTSITQQNTNLSRDFEVLVPVSNGNFTFVAWAGVDDKFTKGTFTNGATTKKDVMLKLNAASGLAANLSGTRVWQGESSAVYLPNPEEYGTLYKHTAVNLREVTNRVKLIVEFDKATMKAYDPKALHAEVSSANGTLHIDGTMPLNEPVLTYPSAVAYGENMATWNYNMLALKTGYNNNLHIYYTGNKEEGEAVFDGDLIAGILLRAVEKGVNMDCENDFTIKFLIKDYCVECWTHFSCSIYVNDWLVHSYETEMGV